MNCAAEPCARCHWHSYSHTSSPTRAWSTPGPTASSSPAPSWLGTMTSKPPAVSPPVVRVFQSVGLTPETSTRTRTSPGPGSGTGTSSMRMRPRSGPEVS